MNQEKEYQGYVGVFDSGVGGLSVLAELTFLNGREKVRPYEVHSLISY